MKQAKAIRQVSNVAENLLGDLDDEVPMIKFGDASVAAPFTSKLSTVMSSKICISYIQHNSM